LHVIPQRRTIAAAMTPVWPTIERFLTQHGAAVLCFGGRVPIRRDAIAVAAPSPEHAAMVPSGTFHG
jgi:hypothetical protein